MVAVSMDPAQPQQPEILWEKCTQSQRQDQHHSQEGRVIPRWEDEDGSSVRDEGALRAEG